VGNQWMYLPKTMNLKISQEWVFANIGQ
jgi:hypothetical protein